MSDRMTDERLAVLRSHCAETAPSGFLAEAIDEIERQREQLYKIGDGMVDGLILHCATEERLRLVAELERLKEAAQAVVDGADVDQDELRIALRRTLEGRP